MQAQLEKAIESVTGQIPRITASGRTDAGTHALGQVIAFTIDSDLAPQALERALNARLPVDIAVREMTETSASFHPRFDARSRTYRYLIWNAPDRSPLRADRATHIRKPLDTNLMNEAIGRLVGRKDFTTFVAASAPGRRTREILDASVCRVGQEVVVELRGNGFMRQMIRSIVGTLIDVGLGRTTLEEFEAIARSGDRTRAGATAPACGLYLVSVQYGDEPSADAGRYGRARSEELK